MDDAGSGGNSYKIDGDERRRICEQVKETDDEKLRNAFQVIAVGSSYTLHVFWE